MELRVMCPVCRMLRGAEGYVSGLQDSALS